MNTKLPTRVDRPTVGIAAAALLFFLIGAVTAALGAAQPDLRLTLHEPANGLNILSFYNFGALIAISFSISPCPRPRPRVRVILFVLIFIAGCIGISIASSWAMLSFASILAGGGYGGLVLYVNAAFADDNLILNGINAIFGTGAVAGPFAIGSAVHKETDFFMIIGIICIATLPVVFCIPESEMPEGAKNPTSERRFRVKSLIVFIPFALYALAYEGLETSVGAFESTHLTGLGIQTSVAARLTSLYWLGLAVGRFVLPWFMRRMSPYSIVVTSLSACTIILPVALLPGAAPYAYASCGFAIAPTFPAALRWMATQVESPRRATATVLISGMAGGSLIPIIISVLIRAYGWPLIPLALTGVAGTCLLAAVSAKFSSTQLKMKINGPPQ